MPPVVSVEVACHARGHGFESRRSRLFTPVSCPSWTPGRTRSCWMSEAEDEAEGIIDGAQLTRLEASR